MSSMKSAICLTFTLLAAMIVTAAPGAVAQDGSIEFVARATPSGGLEEPVRGFPFYLLRKSFEDIKSEADAAVPRPEMDAFIQQRRMLNAYGTYGDRQPHAAKAT